MSLNHGMAVFLCQAVTAPVGPAAMAHVAGNGVWVVMRAAGLQSLYFCRSALVTCARSLWG